MFIWLTPRGQACAQQAAEFREEESQEQLEYSWVGLTELWFLRYPTQPKRALSVGMGAGGSSEQEALCAFGGEGDGMEGTGLPPGHMGLLKEDCSHTDSLAFFEE